MSDNKTAGTISRSDQIFNIAAVAVAIVLVIFHLLAASPFLTLNNTTQAVIHGGLVVAFFLLVSPMKKNKALSRVIDVVLIVITVLAAHQVIVMRNTNTASGVLYSPYQQYISIAFVIVALFIAYRALGTVLPTLSLVFLIYSLVGRYLPGVFATARVTIKRMGTYLMVGDEGLFGNALSTSANFTHIHTSHATTHSEPVYEVDGVVHYAVANIPGAVPYTSTLALTNATLPYALRLADMGWKAACKADKGLAEGVNIVDGKVTFQAVAAAWDLPYTPLDL